MFQTGIEKLGSFENTPIVIDGVMYVTTPYNTAMAYDLKTGKELWRYEHKLGTTIYCCGPNNRGVGIHGAPTSTWGPWTPGCSRSTPKTGKVLWDMEVADPAFGYSITHAPLIIGDNVIVGVSGGEYGIRGHVTAYNAGTGKQVWRWYSIPAPKGDPTFDDKAPERLVGHLGAKTTPEGADLHRDIAKEKADSAKYADAWKPGGGGVWMTPAYDKESNTIFVAVGNPSPDLDGSVRPGDNLYTDAVVAIDATNGKTKWYYQTVPHDVWDLDAVSPPVVTTLGRQEGRGPCRQDRLGLRPRRGHRQAGAQEPELRAAGEHVRAADARRHPDAAGRQRRRRVVADLDRSRASATPSSPGCTSRCTTRSTTHPGRRAASGWARRSWPSRARSSTASSRAVDLKTGKIAWQNKVPQPMMGGALSTAGGLTFTGEGNGNFNAYDSKTGKLLWQFNAGAGCNAAPMSFEHEGEQFIAVACGGNFQLSYPLGDAVLIFGLPKAKK